MIKKQIPNILTTMRLISSIGLVFFQTFSAPFIYLYIFAGITDILDGFFARKLKVTSAFGEKYDSIADFFFIGVCLLKIVPVLNLKMWHLIFVGLIALIKGITFLSSYLYYHNKFFLHTKANKLTGFLLFLSPILMLWIGINCVATVLCIIALFAAVQERHLIRIGR